MRFLENNGDAVIFWLIADVLLDLFGAGVVAENRSF